ncbi:MAG: hypothetical protein V1913_09555 [Fibrobacterota bacterium]
MKRTLIFLFACLFILNAGAKDKTPVPGVCGIAIGVTRGTLLETIRKSSLFTDAECTVDTNAVMINSQKKGMLLCDSLKVASIKCLFNKRPTLQGLSVIFPAANVTDLENIVTALNTMLGNPKSASSDKVGFRYEAEWKDSPYEASFFASDQAFEAYLLLGYSSFVKEEEDRSMKFGK